MQLQTESFKTDAWVLTDTYYNRDTSTNTEAVILVLRTYFQSRFFTTTDSLSIVTLFLRACFQKEQCWQTEKYSIDSNCQTDNVFFAESPPARAQVAFGAELVPLIHSHDPKYSGL